MSNPDFNVLEVTEGEEFGKEMTLNGDEAQLGFDFGALLTTATSGLYEAQKNLLAAQQDKLQAQAIKTTGDVIKEQASKLLARPEVQKLAKEQVAEAAVQKVATSIRGVYTSFMKSPGKYSLYIAGSAIVLAISLRYLSKRK